MKDPILENLYSAPQSDLSNVPSDNETYQPQFISIHGRIGRLRYLAYTWFSAIILSIITGIITAIVMPLLTKSLIAQPMVVSIVVGILLYLPIIAASLIYTKRRLNDLDHSGWFGLLMLVPLLNLLCALYLLFVPGSSGNNRYGAKAEKNSGLMVVAGILLPVVIIGILTAVAIPAYVKYTERAKAASAALHRAP